MSKIDDYLKDVDPSKRQILEHIRKIIKETVPDAEETISYGMPAFNCNKKYFIGFCAYKDHLSLFPTPGPIETFKDDLVNFKLSKGTIQFTEENPISDALVKKIIKYRLKTITEKSDKSYK